MLIHFFHTVKIQYVDCLKMSHIDKTMWGQHDVENILNCGKSLQLMSYST